MSNLCEKSSAEIITKSLQPNFYLLGINYLTLASQENVGSTFMRSKSSLIKGKLGITVKLLYHGLKVIGSSHEKQRL